jgi:sugar lactone lactonase YvrE
VPAEVVWSWPAGHFAENLVVDETGVVFVSLHAQHRIDRYHPVSGRLTSFANLPAPVAGLTLDGRGWLWATGGEVGQGPGYVWRIAPDGAVEQWAEIAGAPFMNGCTLHPDGQTLLVCESLSGKVLAVDLRAPLYVTTNGGLWAPYQGKVEEAKLLRLRVGEVGEGPAALAAQ